MSVKTDKKAAQTLAELHAVGMLTGIWVPPVEVRELRSLVAHREKMVRMSTKAKNRLATVLHRAGGILIGISGDRPFDADRAQRRRRAQCTG